MSGLPASQALILRAVTAAADAGDVCPTNTELGDMISGGASVACGALIALQRKGLITVERFSRTRQVTIVATGAATRCEGRPALHWRDQAELRA